MSQASAPLFLWVMTRGRTKDKKQVSDLGTASDEVADGDCTSRKKTLRFFSC